MSVLIDIAKSMPDDCILYIYSIYSIILYINYRDSNYIVAYADVSKNNVCLHPRI